MRDRLLTDQFYAGTSKVSSKAKHTAKLKSMRSRIGVVDDLYELSGGFKCVHCCQRISSNPLHSGVNNRNHCPYCLWSRHLDLQQAGDRLSACKAPMQPVGLTAKRARKKYGQERPGELMLIHLCVDCGKLSINRTAADDDAGLLLDTFEGSFQIDHELMKRFESFGIEILGAAEGEFVRTRLLGWFEYAPLEKSFA